MQPYLIAIDCDGTLVGDDLILHERTAAVLGGLLEHGHFVVLASGRPYRSLVPFVEKIGLEKMPIITYNGALAFIKGDPSFGYRRAFPLSEATKMAARLLPEVDSLLIDEGDTVYLKKEDAYLDRYFPYRELPCLVDEKKPRLRKDPYVIVFKRKEGVDEPYKTIVESHPGFIYRPWRNSLYAEAYQAGSDKGSALKAVMAYLGMDGSRLIAVGDSDNDLPMLELAAHPFRMPDSRQASLQRFPSAPDTAINEGVAKLLENLPFLR